MFGLEALHGALVFFACQSIHLPYFAGDLQNTLIAMRDSACEAGVALSSYVAIVGGHSALTSECGSMLEEVSSILENIINELRVI